MPTIEHNTASPRRTLSKLRRNKGVANASTNSLASGSADGDDSSEGGLRVSMDAALEKVRGRARRKSADERRGSDDTASRRLSGLISRKKPASKRERQGLERNLSAPSGEDSLSISGNRSEGSLLDSGRSSQFTDDDSEHPGYVNLKTCPSFFTTFVAHKGRYPSLLLLHNVPGIFRIRLLFP